MSGGKFIASQRGAFETEQPLAPATISSRPGALRTACGTNLAAQSAEHALRALHQGLMAINRQSAAVILADRANYGPAMLEWAERVMAE
jgi:hypothetical protein